MDPTVTQHELIIWPRSWGNTGLNTRRVIRADEAQSSQMRSGGESKGRVRRHADQE